MKGYETLDNIYCRSRAFERVGICSIPCSEFTPAQFEPESEFRVDATLESKR